MRINWRFRVESISNRLLFLVVVAAAAFLCIGFYQWEQRLEPIYRFKVIVPGCLYQSGQPAPLNLGRYIEKYKFHTILNLTMRNEEWEHQMTKDLGVKLINLPIDTRNYVPQKWFDNLYEIFSDESNYPMLVHCKHGKNRSSFATAFHRVKFQRWSLESAIDEMVEKGFDPEKYSKSLHSLKNFFPREHASVEDKANEVGIAIVPPAWGTL